jgi:hypothetical protein
MNWNHFRFASLALAALVLSTFSTVSACAWSEDWEGAFYRFFEPDYASLDAYKPFHFTFDRLYDYELLDDKTSESANLASWKTYLGSDIPTADIRLLVYDYDLDMLESIKEGLTKGRALPVEIANNAIAKDWKVNKRREILDYLILAHQAQPLCTFAYDPWSEEERNLEGAQPIIDAAKLGNKNAPDQFLKLRYAYQALRLEQYSDQTEAAIETYQRLVLPNVSGDKLIASWSQAHYAGCLRAKELEAEAAYQFSRVFDECPSRRIQAWYGWRILSDEIWEATQSKCKNNHEMSVVYFLRAFSANAISMEDMQHIHELDPGSTLLDVLLLREINKLENELLGSPYSKDIPVYKRLSKGSATELHDFVIRVLQSGKMHDRNIWELASIYLQFLNGDTQGAAASLATRQATLTGDGAVKGKLLDLVFRIGGAKAVDRSFENSIYKDFTNLSAKIGEVQAEELGRFRDDAFAWLYEAQGENAKALLARNRTYDLYNYPINLDLVNEMIAFNAKEDKTLYEKDLLKRINSEGSTDDFLLDLKGTGLLGRNLLPEAIKVFQKISEGYRKSDQFQLEADPFQTAKIDVVHCTNCGKGKYNKLSYVEMVVGLQQKAISVPDQAAETYLQLGNAYYNTTYFGPAWQAKDYYRSGGSWYSLGVNDEYFTFNIDTFEENVDMTLSRDYYAKALAAAKDKEFAALAVFMMAKCELNQAYIDGAENFNDYRKGFALLKSSYRKSSLYKGLIKECKDFAAYVR